MSDLFANATRAANTIYQRFASFERDIFYVYNDTSHDRATRSFSSLSGHTYRWQVRAIIIPPGTKVNLTSRDTQRSDLTILIKPQRLYDAEEAYKLSVDPDYVPGSRQYPNNDDYIVLLSRNGVPSNPEDIRASAKDLMANGRVYRIIQQEVYVGDQIVELSCSAIDFNDQAIERISNDSRIGSDDNLNISSPSGDTRQFR